MRDVRFALVNPAARYLLLSLSARLDFYMYIPRAFLLYAKFSKPSLMYLWDYRRRRESLVYWVVLIYMMYNVLWFMGAEVLMGKFLSFGGWLMSNIDGKF